MAMNQREKAARKVDDEESICESCCTSGVPVKAYNRPYPQQGTRDLCDLCADTFIGNVTGYPKLYPELQMIAQCMVQLAWKIIRAQDADWLSRNERKEI